MKTLILMGGKRMEGRNDIYPLYMAEIDRKMIIEWQLEKCLSLAPSEIHCCVRREDIADFHINEIIQHNTGAASISVIRSKTAGALCTALLAIEHLDNDEELLILACNEMMDIDYGQILDLFRERDLDAGLVIFPSSHPQYAFVKLDENGEVREVAEKRLVSRNALTSFFYFKKGSDFVRCAKNVIIKDIPCNGSFFISQSINEMILMQKKIGVHVIDANKFHPFKTEMQLLLYMQERNFALQNNGTCKQ